MAVKPCAIDASGILRMSRALILALAVAVASGGCALYPVISDADEHALNLRGYDPVAYFTLGRPVPGRAEFHARHAGVSYRFASREHQALFIANPHRYAPQYGGWCAHGMAYAVKLGSDPLFWRIHAGRLFIYGDREGHDFAGERLAFHIERADQYWTDEVKDALPWWQYVKRVWLARVPHYRSGCELEAQWLRRYPDKPHELFKGRCARG